MSDNPTPTTSRPAGHPEGFDAMIAQRAEAVGGDGTTFEMPGFGRTWHLKSPVLANTEWKDEYAQLTEDLGEGTISLAVFRDEVLNLVLGDQADDFSEACDAALDGKGVDPLDLVQYALREHQKQVNENPSQRSSRNTRRRSKRR